MPGRAEQGKEKSGARVPTQTFAGLPLRAEDLPVDLVAMSLILTPYWQSATAGKSRIVRHSEISFRKKSLAKKRLFVKPE